MACTFKKFRLFFVFFRAFSQQLQFARTPLPSSAAAPPPPARRLVGRWTTTRTGQAVLGRSCARAPCGGVTLMTRCTPRSRGGCGSAHPAPAQLAVPPRTWTAVDGYRAGTRRAGAPLAARRQIRFPTTCAHWGSKARRRRLANGRFLCARIREKAVQPCGAPVRLFFCLWRLGRLCVQVQAPGRGRENSRGGQGARPHPMQRSASSAREVHPRVSGYTRTNLKRATAMLFRAVAVREYTCAVVCGLDARSFPVHSGDERTSRTKRFQILPPPRRMRASPHAPSGGTQLERWRYRIAGDAGV